MTYIRERGHVEPWFAADHHMFHKRINEFCDRPFGSMEQSIDALVSRHNERVAPGDVVYFLGDIFFNSQRCLEEGKYGPVVNEGMLDRRPEILAAMNGSKFLIRGNHDFTDSWPPALLEQFVWIKDLHFQLKIRQLKRIFAMCHYPLMTWPGYKRGVIHVHGHVHSSDPLAYRLATKPAEIESGPDIQGHRRVELWRSSLDVGVDGNNWYPWHGQEVIDACTEDGDA